MSKISDVFVCSHSFSGIRTWGKNLWIKTQIYFLELKYQIIALNLNTPCHMLYIDGKGSPRKVETETLQI